MNVLLWILQGLLAVHTMIGAVWKVSNPAQSMPSLAAIPQGIWMSLIGIEALCAIGLVLPLVARGTGVVVPVAAIIIALEMIMFCVFHLRSEATETGPLIYWGVVVVICLFIAWGRSFSAPL